jgi:hypothetical protein
VEPRDDVTTSARAHVAQSPARSGVASPRSGGVVTSYSALNVTAGSTRAARHAGTQEAAADTPISSAITAT